MSLRATLENVTAGVTLLRTYRAECESGHRIVSVFERMVADPPALTQMPDRDALKSALAEAAGNYQENLRRLMILESAGEARTMSGALLELSSGDIVS